MVKKTDETNFELLLESCWEDFWNLVKQSFQIFDQRFHRLQYDTNEG